LINKCFNIYFASAIKMLPKSGFNWSFILIIFMNMKICKISIRFIYLIIIRVSKIAAVNIYLIFAKFYRMKIYDDLYDVQVKRGIENSIRIIDLSCKYWSNFIAHYHLLFIPLYYQINTFPYFCPLVYNILLLLFIIINIVKREVH
jgi:hypothetical protein